MAREIMDELREGEPSRQVDFSIAPDLTVRGDQTSLRTVLANLLANAWKFTGQKERARIEVGVEELEGEKAYYVGDNGI